MQSIRVTVPAPSSELVTNLLGVAGMAGIAVSVGALAGNWWWTALVVSVFMIVVAYIAQNNYEILEAEDQAEDDVPAAAAAADTTAWAPVPPWAAEAVARSA